MDVASASKPMEEVRLRHSKEDKKRYKKQRKWNKRYRHAATQT